MSEKEKLKETLSALFDDEAGKFDQLELRRLVRSLDDNPDLIATYQRYMLARSALNGSPVAAKPADFLDNVRAALEQETMEDVAVSAAINKNREAGVSNLRWLKSLGRVAVAASVAVVAVYVIQQQVPAAVQTATLNVTPDTAALNTIEVLNERNNRMLSPDVMAVSAGDRQPFDHSVGDPAKMSPGCTISPLRADNSRLVWEKALPAGYVLCKQKDQSRKCESVASRIGCYLN